VSSAASTQPFRVGVGAVNAIVVDNLGEVGIGTTNPAYILDVSGGTGTKIHDMYINAQNNSTMAISSIGIKNANNFGTGFALYQGTNGDTVLNAYSGQQIDFKINNDNKVRIDSAGRVGIGVTAPVYTLDVSSASTQPFRVGVGATNALVVDNNGRVGIGTNNPQSALHVNGQTNATSFNATSDYRIKSNIVSLNETPFTVDLLNPVTYYNKLINKQEIGFIAHEIQENIPFLVSGEKDANEYQSLNYLGIIGLLTNEIKNNKKENKILKEENKILKEENKILKEELVAAKEQINDILSRLEKAGL
jgi:hypothetical protein